METILPQPGVAARFLMMATYQEIEEDD